MEKITVWIYAQIRMGIFMRFYQKRAGGVKWQDFFLPALGLNGCLVPAARANCASASGSAFLTLEIFLIGGKQPGHSGNRGKADSLSNKQEM
ncbi:MAG: hypothetical protein A3F73_08115 [Gallionellales bacterium RIFCSPLOWO2_12_FULL_59_22]|nr:MAG: hypothetical protein A3H99_10485 [Gallionellales bacterium RIFCSPLOWO2_02_FULL_59_110]OGT04263.1 MAG: hypothetical protein A2Z65_05995 [Gallionellales bacterium RIFCSPLOWO2_02_58_13]OGT13293.1 MAG: hypothetical protein A3F73_08115 [Gallionellales bacterium RIFCSPLOWO2_12_FULL_59_22]